MLTKDRVIQTVNELPEQFSVDELLDRILLLQKIEIGREQSKAGLTFSNEEAKVRLSRWLK